MKRDARFARTLPFFPTRRSTLENTARLARALPTLPTKTARRTTKEKKNSSPSMEKTCFDRSCAQRYRRGRCAPFCAAFFLFQYSSVFLITTYVPVVGDFDTKTKAKNTRLTQNTTKEPIGVDRILSSRGAPN